MKPERDPQQGGENPENRRHFQKDARPDDTLGKDFWDLDDPAAPGDDPPLGEEAGDSGSPDDSPPSSSAVPVAPRSTRRDVSFKVGAPKKQAPHKKMEDAEEDSLEKEPGKAGGFTQRTSGSAIADLTFDDLEDSLGDKTKPASTVDEPPAAAAVPPASEPVLPPEREENPPDEPTPASPTREEARELDETPAKTPARTISGAERLGLAGFIILLLAGFLFFFLNSLNKLPDQEDPLSPGDLPISGKTITAEEITTYWREPDASRGDVFRRGTVLLPVVELGVSGSTGAVRIFFRDSEGATVGDGVTKPVRGDTTLTIPATAGFDEDGMFAAYRTGDTDAWTIEVFEGPSVNADGGEFHKLFEMPISTQRR